MKRKMMLIVPMLHQGGFERVCINTARLMEPYFDVTIVIFTGENIAYDITGLNIIDIQMGTKKGKIRKILNIIKRSRRVKQLKKDLEPEIAYSFGPTANMANAFSRTRRTKVWLGLRNYTDIEERVKIRLFVRFADLIICCSKKIEEELNTKFHFKKTTTLYNLYDVEAIRKEADAVEPELPWEDSAAYLLSMGRDDDQKGFWHMLKVFSKVHETCPDTRLIIMGAGSYGQYKKLSKELGIGQAVYFAGMQKEPYPYLKKGSIYLMTSLNEGFPNALVEGMALGLAAVSVDCKTGPSEILLEEYDPQVFEEQRQKGEIPVIWGEYGILMPAMDQDKNMDATQISREEQNMAEVIIRLLSDGELLGQYQSAAVERARIFTYENYVRELLKLWQDA